MRGQVNMHDTEPQWWPIQLISPTIAGKENRVLDLEFGYSS